MANILWEHYPDRWVCWVYWGEGKDCSLYVARPGMYAKPVAYRLKHDGTIHTTLPYLNIEVES